MIIIELDKQTGPQTPSSEMIIDKVKIIDIPIQSEERKTKNIEISVAGIGLIHLFLV